MANPNTIDYAEKYQGFIDEELEAHSYTQWMAPNDDMIEYNGGKTIKIARVETSGLGDYNAHAPIGTAYPKGSVKLVWDDYDIEMDRAVRFELGRLDPSDSNFIVTTENVTRTFSRKQLVPEQDMFRFNRVYARLAASIKWKGTHIKEVSGALTSGTAVSTLMELWNTVRDDAGEEVDHICFMSLKNEQAFRDAAKNTHNSITFGNSVSVNGVTYNNAMIVNGLPCVFVPSKRLQTMIKVNDGRTAGQEKGGIEADAASKQIEFLITNSDAPMAVNRVTSLKVFSADEMQEGDETTINYHLLYDCWLLTNQIVTTAACVQQ